MRTLHDLKVCYGNFVCKWAQITFYISFWVIFFASYISSLQIQICFKIRYIQKSYHMADKISSKILGAIGTVGSLVASVFLSPPQYVWGISGLVVAAASLGLVLRQQWVQSQPNEWLLVIRNGQLLKAGVGLKTFVGFSDTVVRFPSKVQKVQFRANNVTKQMQGVIITGFAFWSVFRDEDGPFRCYKYMQGGDANSNVQAMCESVLRNLIANSTLDEVLKNRNHLRDNMKKDLKDQFKGWGIWLQTVQITEVTISSERLFKDLQAQFRQQTRLKAQNIDLRTNQQMTKQRQASEMKMAQIQEFNNTKKQQTRNTQQMKRANQQAEYDLKKNQLQLKTVQKQKEYELKRVQRQKQFQFKRMQKQKEFQIKRVQKERQFQIQKLKSDLQQQQQLIANQHTIRSIKQNFQIQYQKKLLEVDRLHDTKTLQKYQIDSMERIYNKLGIKEVRINQFVGGENQNGLASILPSLGYTMNQMKTAE